MVFGYRIGEVPLKIKRPDASLGFYLKASSLIRRKRRGPMLHTANFQIQDRQTGLPSFVPLIPDNDDPHNEVAAVISRFGTIMPDIDIVEQRKFEQYYKFFIQYNWTELVEPSEIPTLVKFLRDLANYPSTRSENLLKLRESLHITQNRGGRATCSSKGFIKHETYSEFKAPRAINSYTDESKTILAPLCHAIDKKTFKSKFFVKGTNPKTWPERLEGLFAGLPVVGTDFTAFESHHSGVYSRAIKFWMLHMIRKVPNNRPLKELISLMTSMRNRCALKHLKVEVDERLMSGALWTSSANGVLNLLLNSYLAADAAGLTDPQLMAQWAVTKFRGIFEGDDGLSVDYGQKDTTIARMGLILKLERQQDYSKAGFCGIVCERGKPDVLKDPIDVMTKFFWLPPKYHTWKETKKMGLMRAKALSYKHIFGNSPIIGELCDWILRETKDKRAIWDGVRDGYHSALSKEEARTAWKAEINVSVEARCLIESRFNVPHQFQLMYEDNFRRAVGPVCLQDSDPHTSKEKEMNRSLYFRRDAGSFHPPAATGATWDQLVDCFPYKRGNYCYFLMHENATYDHNYVLEPLLQANFDGPNTYQPLPAGGVPPAKSEEDRVDQL